MPPVLGVSRGASLLAALQPVYRVAAELDRHAYGLGVLDVAAVGRLSADDGADHASRQPALPVLDPYRAGSFARTAGNAAEYPLASPGTPRIEPPLHRSQSCRHAYHLGPSVRNVRTRRGR